MDMKVWFSNFAACTQKLEKITRGRLFSGLYGNYCNTGFGVKNQHTVFPQIDSAETILFWKWKMWKFSYSFRIMATFLLHKLNSCHGNNWKGETIRGRKLFTKILNFENWCSREVSKSAKIWLSNKFCISKIIGIFPNFFIEE